jgi:hypothetical protein
MTRHLLLLALLVSTPALAQRGAPAAPIKATRPKVLAPPAPVPAAPTAATPAPKKRPPSKPSKPVNPAAAYLPKVKATFAKRWSEAVQPRIEEFVPGNVSVKFKLDAEGKVADFAVTENTSNEPFAKFCEEFVRETEFEKPPAKALAEGLLEIPFTFWIY